MSKILLCFCLQLLLIPITACEGNIQSTPSSVPSEKILEVSEKNSDSDVVLSPSSETDAETAKSDASEIVADENDMYDVEITVGNSVFAAKFYDNASAQAIIVQMPFSLNMGDYAGQEKVTELSFSLPNASTESPATIRSGELYLWSGNCLVLFYTTFSNSYSYVPIGYIEDTTGLTEALGSGSVQAAFALNE